MVEISSRKCSLVSLGIPNDYVEKVSISLVREYLYKKGFKSSLKALNHDRGTFPGTHDRRAALAKELNLECLMRQNKLNTNNFKTTSNYSEKPLESMLEVLVKSFVLQSQRRFTKKSETTQTSPEIKTISFHDISIQTALTPDPFCSSQLDQQGVHTADSPDDNIKMSSGQRGHYLDEKDCNSELKTDIHCSLGTSDPGSKPSVPKNLGKFSRGNSKGDQDSSDSCLEPISPPSHSVSNSQQGYDNQFHIKQSTRLKQKHSPNSEEPKGHNFLQSKQDALAQMCLTRAENQARNIKQTSSEDAEDETHPEVKVLQGSAGLKGHGKPEPVMEFQDIDDDDLGITDSDNRQNSLLIIRNPSKVKEKSDRLVTQLDLKVWRGLKTAVVGTNGFLQEGWIGQGFSFDSQIPYGLVQKKGGPCGVLAVLQALVIRNLMFGSEFCDEGLPLYEFFQFLSKSSSSNSNPVGLSTAHTTTPVIQNQYRSIVSKRSNALIAALVEILWRCGSASSKESEDQTREHMVKICFQGNEPGSEVVHLTTLEGLKKFVADNLYQFDCIGLVYSTVLSRGIDKIQEDMDFPNSPLLGQHGYCSQELVNLLLFGKGISNAFDNQVTLDDKVLQGIETQSDIGLLSLFEHYGSFEVGSHLKNPKFPLWIVCSESHFSVLFSHEKSLTFADKETFYQTNGFDLFYYDGLAHQSEIIRLTIGFTRNQEQGGFLSIPNGFLNQPVSKPSSEVQDDNLIPPLDKCIRTRWKNARVFWNGIEPIL